MKVWHAAFVSIALHAAAIGTVLYSGANVDTKGLAKPPSSLIRARILTYQNGDGANMAAPDNTALMSPEVLAVIAPIGSSDSSLAVPMAAAQAAQVAAGGIEAIPDSGSLDSSPELLSQVTLEYPLSANNREGLVTLAIVVAGDGRVDDVQVVKAVPSGFFEGAAIAGFKSARFSPGMLGGIGVKSRMVIEVEFMPTNRGGSVGVAR